MVEPSDLGVREGRWKQGGCCRPPRPTRASAQARAAAPCGTRREPRAREDDGGHEPYSDTGSGQEGAIGAARFTLVESVPVIRRENGERSREREVVERGPDDVRAIGVVDVPIVDRQVRDALRDPFSPAEVVASVRIGDDDSAALDDAVPARQRTDAEARERDDEREEKRRAAPLQRAARSRRHRAHSTERARARTASSFVRNAEGRPSRPPLASPSARGSGRASFQDGHYRMRVIVFVRTPSPVDSFRK